MVALRGEEPPGSTQSASRSGRICKSSESIQMFSKVSESLQQDSQETDVALIQLLRDPLNGEKHYSIGDFVAMSFTEKLEKIERLVQRWVSNWHIVAVQLAAHFDIVAIPKFKASGLYTLERFSPKSGSCRVSVVHCSPMSWSATAPLSALSAHRTPLLARVGCFIAQILNVAFVVKGMLSLRTYRSVGTWCKLGRLPNLTKGPG
jgi:hypothetical protein